MSRCLELARGGLGWVSPNPLVGAVIVHDGKIVGEGFHRQVGLAHAEVEAIAAAGDKCRGATLYVNLEPCNHHGRTPPCTEAIITSGIKRVVVGMVDPNPLVSGQGIARLGKAGIAVTVGALEAKCKKLNRIFIHWITTKCPYVAAKVAISNDYKIAVKPGVRTHITGPEAQAKVHELRQTYDAILVGAGTMLADDPELSVRHYPNRPRDPRRIIFDSTLRLPLTAKVLRDSHVLLATTSAVDVGKLKKLKQRGIPVVVTKGADGNVNIAEVLDWCARNSITSILVEGGRQVLDSFVRARLIQQWYVFVAPHTLGEQGLDALSDLGPLQRCRAQKEFQTFGQDRLYDSSVIGCPAVIRMTDESVDRTCSPC